MGEYLWLTGRITGWQIFWMMVGVFVASVVGSAIAAYFFNRRN